MIAAAFSYLAPVEGALLQEAINHECTAGAARAI